MRKRTTAKAKLTRPPLKTQMKRRTAKGIKKKKELDGNTEIMISTGSTLLDLAICGTRIRGGGLPGGIMVEVFGPSGSGKTVLLCEIAGAIQRKAGSIMFRDPEARLNQAFASIFDLDTKTIDYGTPDTVPELFQAIRKWEPETKGINGIMADSLAALSTDMEMEKEDAMGMKRAKDFSTQLRKTARVLVQKNFLLVCSNQLREDMNAVGKYAIKDISPGGKAIAFYSSLRLRVIGFQKIYKEIKVAGKDVKRVIGIKSQVEVFKSSIDRPYRKAPLTILFDYGIDDVRQNLQFVKDYTKNTTYTCCGTNLDASMNKSIRMVEEGEWEKDLKEEVIDLWESIEGKFISERKKKKR